MQVSLLPIPKWNNTTGLALQIGLENLQSQLLIFCQFDFVIHCIYLKVTKLQNAVVLININRVKML